MDAEAGWTCRHCEHWRHGSAGAYGGHAARAPTCAQGEDPFWVLSPTDCSRYTREPGADDELETPPKARGDAVSHRQPQGAIHAWTHHRGR